MVATPSRAHWVVIVVGAVISGALVAEVLTRGRKPHRVLALDRRAAVRGSTPA